MEGWIKIHRKIWDNPIIRKDNTHFLVWMYLLLHATHKEYDVIFNNQRITLKQGQLLVGRRSIAVELGVSESKIQRILKLFESEQQIEQQTTPQNRLISILNWDKYQNSEQPFEQQVNNNRTTSEQQVNTNKNIKNNNNIKNLEKEKYKKEKVTFDDIFSANNFSAELENTLRDFIDMRKAIKKPMTSKALELLIRNLEKLTNLEAEKIEILNQSIEHGWQTVYPLKRNVISQKSGADLWLEKMKEKEGKNVI